MPEETIPTLGVVYFLVGVFLGAITAAFIGSVISKVGGALIGGVGAAASGIVFLLYVTDIESKFDPRFGIAAADILPSFIASALFAGFLVYVIGLIAGKRGT